MYVIQISKEVMNIVNEVCRRIRSEWYALSLGTYQRKKDIHIFCIIDLLIPEQVASFTHVEIPPQVNVEVVSRIEAIRSEDKDMFLLGMLHSHGEFDVFHSNEDLRNIDTIFECFSSYLPSFYGIESLVGVFKEKIVNLEPMIENNSFRGIKMDFGATKIEIDFGVLIRDPNFFVKWYKHFYDIKCLFEVLKTVYKTSPIIKNVSKNKLYLIPSVVVNNRGDVLGEVFIFESKADGLYKKTEKAKIETTSISKKPYFLSKERVSDIIGRVKGVI